MGSSITELERAHLEPPRPHLARARRIAGRAATGREAWDRLDSEGLVPPGERWFRVTARELARAGHRDEDLRRINLSSTCATERALVLPHPGTPEAAVAFASVDGLREAEQHAREYLLRLQPFRFLIRRRAKPGAKSPVWRILGSPVGARFDGPADTDIEGAYDLAQLASQLANASPLSNRASRFIHAAIHLTACEHWAQAERPIPAQVHAAGIAQWTPQQLIRKRLESFPNPFEPLVAIWRLGFGIRRLTEETILLYLPHAAPWTDAKKDRVRLAAFDEETLRQTILNAETVPALELLERRVDPNGEDARGRTALHCAIVAGHRTQTALLSALLAAGADPDREDDDGMTALAMSVAYDQRRLARALFELGLDPKQRLAGGRSLLHVAARSGSSRMIELLLEQGLAVDTACARGRTPLHEAAMVRASSYAVEAATRLLAHGADPNLRDRFGWTPLHYAALDPYSSMMAELLVDRGARSLPDRGGRLPTDLAHQTAIPRAISRAPRGVATPLDPLPDPARNPELEAAIRASPGDDGAWSVYADWLSSRGEPHAELIQLGLASNRARGDERARLRRALAHALEDRRFEIYGELQRIEPTIAALPHPDYRFEHGFLTGLDHRGTIAELRGILSSDAARFLRQLSASGAQSVLQLLEGIGSQSLESIALAFCAAPLLRPLATSLPRVRRLRLFGLLPRAIHWPALEELSFAASGAPPDEPHPLDADLPDLRTLRLAASDDRARPLLLALARAPLPKLTAFSWSGPGSSFREISHAPWFATLELLDLVRANPEAIARLEQIVPERPNLRRVRVVATHLATREKRALAARLSVFVKRARVS